MRETCVLRIIRTQNYLTPICSDNVFFMKYLYFKQNIYLLMESNCSKYFDMSNYKINNVFN